MPPGLTNRGSQDRNDTRELTRAAGRARKYSQPLRSATSSDAAFLRAIPVAHSGLADNRGGVRAHRLGRLLDERRSAAAAPGVLAPVLDAPGLRCGPLLHALRAGCLPFRGPPFQSTRDVPYEAHASIIAVRRRGVTGGQSGLPPRSGIRPSRRRLACHRSDLRRRPKLRDRRRPRSRLLLAPVSQTGIARKPARFALVPAVLASLSRRRLSSAQVALTLAALRPDRCRRAAISATLRESLRNGVNAVDERPHGSSFARYSRGRPAPRHRSNSLTEGTPAAGC
jgi:hypothetical protein